MSALFQPYQLKSVTLRNRIAVPPMCQYSAVDGVAGDWHQAHYAGLGRGGAGLVIVEATAVSPEGRITPADLGIWNDAQAEALARVASAIKAGGAVPGIQLAHAGRKAGSNRPWEGDDQMDAADPRSWQALAPSALAHGANWPRTPREMSVADIARVQRDFAAAARRALDAGFEWMELHFAHGYLAQTFLSPYANRRGDAYGGGYAGRSRFMIETLAAVRAVWPAHLPLTVRLGVTEFNGHDEEDLLEAIALATRFRQDGLDFLDASIGFTVAGAAVPWHHTGFMLPLAERIGRASGLPMAASWGLGQPELAQRAVETGQVALVMVARAHLANPHWTFHAARRLGVPRPAAVLPPPYHYWLERYNAAD
jgi:2,4-dienoyl-CoA reductase-like NADH-dependent reductase (Old Yellow Enzyme family)